MTRPLAFALVPLLIGCGGSQFGAGDPPVVDSGSTDDVTTDPPAQDAGADVVGLGVAAHEAGVAEASTVPETGPIVAICTVGCVDPATLACLGGTSLTACGAYGQACQNCSLLGYTCRGGACVLWLSTESGQTCPNAAGTFCSCNSGSCTPAANNGFDFGPGTQACCMPGGTNTNTLCGCTWTLDGGPTRCAQNMACH